MTEHINCVVCGRPLERGHKCPPKTIAAVNRRYSGEAIVRTPTLAERLKNGFEMLGYDQERKRRDPVQSVFRTRHLSLPPAPPAECRPYTGANFVNMPIGKATKK